ncbi:MAG: sulfotransferase [Acidimicrobiales bacterium]|nr:sulfotransferase [Acidimicrobiales bacterium]HRW36096.1 sulfotransferase [Aquihabitans sp.]
MERLDRDRLVEEALDRAGGDDLGADTWQEGLDRLLGALHEEARLHELGVEVAAGAIVDYLANRAGITAYRTAHPEVAERAIERPIFIVGQPRTGTTILFDLLALDPALRAPLTWEVDRPLPPPDPATRDHDPRIEEVDAVLAMADLVVPGFTAFHPMGARLAQECVRITGGDFRSMIFDVQFRVPSYNRWLLHEADLAPAYAWHRQYLQHLEALEPEGQQWLLKSPGHLWSLDALAAEHPDAIVVQTHRDPIKVITSVSALYAHLRRMTTDDPDLPEIARQLVDDIFLGLDRGLDARARGVIAPERIVDVQFRDFVADPIATVQQVYAALGRDLAPEAEGRMRAFLAEHPGDGGGGGTRYRFADTGLDGDALRQRAAPYQEAMGVASEPIV